MKRFGLRGAACSLVAMAQLAACTSSSDDTTTVTGPSGDIGVAITAIGRTSVPTAGGETPCASFDEFGGARLPITLKVDNFWLFPPSLCPVPQCGQVALFVGTSESDLTLNSVQAAPVVDVVLGDLAAPEGEHLFRVELRHDGTFAPFLGADGGPLFAEATARLAHSAAECAGTADAGEDQAAPPLDAEADSAETTSEGGAAADAAAPDAGTDAPEFEAAPPDGATVEPDAGIEPDASETSDAEATDAVSSD